jgi:hypothetical protein
VASIDSTDALFAQNVEQKMSNPLAHFFAARSFLDRLTKLLRGREIPEFSRRFEIRPAPRDRIRTPMCWSLPAVRRGWSAPPLAEVAVPSRSRQQPRVCRHLEFGSVDSLTSRGALLALPLGPDHLNDLPAAGEEVGQQLHGLVGNRARCQSGSLAKMGDDRSIDRIGLGAFPQRPGTCAGLTTAAGKPAPAKAAETTISNRPWLPRR